MNCLEGCIIEKGVYIGTGSWTIDQFRVTGGQNECSSRCALTNKCVAWTYKVSDLYCWLNSDDSSKGQSDGWITGTKACGSTGNYQ